MNPPNPLLAAAFLTVAFVLAGFLQSFWLRSPLSSRFQTPLDGEARFRGRRIFGDNKTWRGFVAMVPAVGIVFVLLRLLLAPLTELGQGLWPLSVLEYGLLGCWVGMGFMIGELPNSFIKRQLDIPSGEAPQTDWARPVCFVVDRLDSIAGGLFALAIAVPTPPVTWLLILLVGPAFHWAFSFFLYYLGVKARPA